MKHFYIILSAIFITMLLVKTPFTFAVDCLGEAPKDRQAILDYIAACKTKLADLSGQKKTLADAVSYLNTQISLTQAKIVATEQDLRELENEITDLSGKIVSIDYSLDDLTKIFVARVRETYIRKQDSPAEIVVQASGIPDFFRLMEYAKRIRDHDHEILVVLEKSRLDFDNQKKSKEVKQVEVEKLSVELAAQRTALSGQKSAKDKLLAETKNSESQYQKLLSQAQAELVAIQGIIAGLGREVSVGNVEEGARIATIIQGASACSSGAHLHYEVAQNGNRRNPLELLKNTSLSWDNADPAQNGNGSWNWPVSNPIRITQGYGHTAYSSRYTNDVHTGVDMASTSSTVVAVKPGELYQGSVRCGGGSLVYVRVKQTDGYDSYYLHVNY